MNWYLKVLKNYAVFTGRAHRTEYWFFFLFNLIFTIVLNVVDNVIGMPGVLSGIYALAVLIPGLAVAVRRLHDTGRTGWWMLLLLLPLIGGIILLIFFVLEGNKGPNQYGEDPLGAAEQASPKA